ncbi:hypothetical protein EJ06DRAFT_557783 [Trichodelitschia bisporula]|uniref:Uncharacterized protein n=1 Tax=Trichodelitschia bisporula TaxID=703511 RepID=A0A6G1HTE5_9PEZI|nr:hypothetical protein EJ06DRAFT_557783 [Trichodelitschia bisporula]
MPRTTRAAAKAQVDSSPAATPTPDAPTERDLSGSESIVVEHVATEQTAEPTEPVKKSKSKKNRRKKNKKATAEAGGPEAPGTEAEARDQPEVEIAPAPEMSAESAEGAGIDDSNDVEPDAPTEPEKPVRLTRSQLAKAEAEREASDAPGSEPGQEPEAVTQTIEEPMEFTVEQPTEETMEPPSEPAVTSDIPETVVNTTEDHLSKIVEAAPSASPQLSPALDQASTISETPTMPSPTESRDRPSVSPSIAISQPEDPIEAIDALEDAIEEVGNSLPLDSPVSPTKPHSRTRAGKKEDAKPVAKPATAQKDPVIIGKPPARTSSIRAAKPPAKHARAGSVAGPVSKATVLKAPVTKPTTKVPATTASKAPAKAPATTTSKTPAKAPAKAPPTLSKSTRTRPVSMAIPRNPSIAEEAPSASTRQRPVSLHFPTPPPAVKSSKPPTKPTFTLPGDAVAAKLKAAREERQKREAEEREAEPEKRAFKARPAPALRARPVAVKQTAASRARQSMAPAAEGGLSGSDKENPPVGKMGGLRRASTVTGATTSSVKRTASTRVASKTVEKAEVKKPAPRVSSLTIAKRQSVVPKRPTPPESRSTSHDGKTPLPALPLREAKNAITSTDVKTQKLKGREVYNRDKMEKEAREREKREKEDAARRARAEAAERGRQASREWAEKQKRKVLGVSVAEKAEAEDKAEDKAEVSLPSPVPILQVEGTQVV